MRALMSALVRREGVLLLETIEELCDTAEILVRFVQRPTGGAGIVTNSGAFKGIAADLADSLGLDLPAPSADGTTWIADGLPPFATVENPLDVTGQSIKDPGILGHAANGLLRERNIGSLLAAIVGGSGQGAIDKADALLPAMTESPKPSVVAVFGDDSPLPPEFAARFRDNGIPFYRSPERALRALARATAYGQSLEGLEARAEPRNLPPIALPPDGTLPEYKGKEIMASLGATVPAGELAIDFDGAKKIAARIGFPVVLKAQAADLAHKSDVGGVIVGIRDEGALADAWDKLNANVAAARPDLALDGVLVDAMAPAGVEMVVGARRDPAWGPVTMVGLGGVWIEALKDVRLLAVDLTEDQIAEEIGRLRGAALLGGLRGSPPADIAALARLVGLVSALMAAKPEIAEIDLNPVVVHAEGQGATVLDVLIATAP